MIVKNKYMLNSINVLLLTLLFQVVGYAQTGNVGVGNNTPVAKLDVAGDLALREGTAIPATGANPSISIALNATNAENSFYRITGSPTGTMTLNSIANGVDGQIITLVNATTIKLKISNTNSAGGILTSGGATTVIASNGSVTLQYSSGAARWFVTNAAGATITDWTKATTADEPAVKTDNQYVSGSVGIGDFSGSSPTAKFEIIGGADNTGANDPFAIAFQYRTGGYRHWISTRHNGVAGSNQNAIDFYLNNSTTATASSAPTVGTSHGMSITATGVGIGTKLPIATLHAVAPAATNAFAGRFTQTNTTNGNNTFIGLGTENATWSKAAIGFQRTGSYDVGDITFNLNSNASSGTDVSTSDERVRIKNNGDIQMTGAGGNKLWLETNNWTDPGATGAGVAVDNNTYKSLMIVGNNVSGNKGQGREVQMWDYLKVNGYLTVGTQANATATAPPSGTIRYNTTRKCMEYYDGTYWICMGPPTVQRITVRDQNDENYQGTGCNSCTGWGGSYGNVYNFTVSNLYAGQKIMFYAEVMFDNDTKKNGGFLNATKIYGNGYWAEDEVVVPGGWETVQTKVFPAQTITSTGNLTFSFESNTGITDVRITAVAY